MNGRWRMERLAGLICMKGSAEADVICRDQKQMSYVCRDQKRMSYIRIWQIMICATVQSLNWLFFSLWPVMMAAEWNLFLRGRVRAARVNQQPPVHHEGWMGTWLGNSFLLDSSSLTNHGHSLSCFFYLPFNNPQASR